MKWRLQFIPWRVCSTLLSWALYRVTGLLTWHCLTTGGLPFPQMHFRASWNQVIGRFLVSRVNSRRSQTTVRYCSFTAIGVSDNSIVGIRSDRPARLRPLEGRTCSARAVLKIQYPILQWAASEQTSQMMIASGTSKKRSWGVSLVAVHNKDRKECKASYWSYCIVYCVTSSLPHAKR